MQSGIHLSNNYIINIILYIYYNLLLIIIFQKK